MATYTFDKRPTIAKTYVGGTTTVFAQYELTAALGDDDTIGDIPLPKNAYITDSRMITTELDTNASPTLTLNLGIFADGSAGTTDDEDALIDGMTTGDARNEQGINVSSITSNNVATGHGYKITGDNAVARVTVDGAPATGATSGHVIVLIEYTLDAV